MLVFGLKVSVMKKTNICLALAISLVSSSILAEGIPIEPGMWEITSTMTMPMLPQPRISTNSKCIEEAEISPEKMNQEDMDSDCSFDTRVVDGDTMNWSMNCDTQGGASSGEWEVTSHGDTLTGGGTITVDMQGQSMSMSMKWDGKRVGDCD